MGALAAWTPTQLVKITTYAAEEYGYVFKKPCMNILITTSARSFWEKTAILHAEAFRPKGSSMPSRYSRHYYDLYVMAHSKVKEDVLNQPELLQPLRHLSAALLISLGVPLKNVSSRLGHADIRTTANIYGAALQSVDRQAADKLDPY